MVSPSNAGDVGLIPGKGTKISHAVGQLSPCTLSLWTTEPMHSRAPVHYKRKPTCFDVDPGRQKKKKKNQRIKKRNLEREHRSSVHDLSFSSRKTELQIYQLLSQFFPARCFFPAQIH